jgi:hypothetical protein
MATTQATGTRAGADRQDEGQATRILDTISGVSSDASERLGVVAESAGEAVREADRTLRDSSDQTLGLLGGLSLGFAGGLLFSGANRVLIIVSLVPALLVAMAAWERIERSGRGRRPRVSQEHTR